MYAIVRNVATAPRSSRATVVPRARSSNQSLRSLMDHRFCEFRIMVRWGGSVKCRSTSIELLDSACRGDLYGLGCFVPPRAVRLCRRHGFRHWNCEGTSTSPGTLDRAGLRKLDRRQQLVDDSIHPEQWRAAWHVVSGNRRRDWI